MSYYHQETWLPMMRSITKEKFFCDPYCVQLYLYFYLSAKRHEDMIGIDPLLRGQFETTQSHITEYLKIPRQVLRSRMQKLQDMGYITVRSHHRKSTIITVRMYDNLLGVVKTSRGGWVKLYDAAVSSLFFMSPTAVVVYVTLLSLQRNDQPLKISMRNFAGECGLTVKEVIAGIKKLQREDIVNCKMKTGHGRIEIGFKNGGLELPPEDEFDALESPKSQPSINQVPTRTLPEVHQEPTNESIEEGEFENCITTYCKTNSCNPCQPSNNQVITKEKPTDFSSHSSVTSEKSALARDTYLNEIRDREEIESERGGETLSPTPTESIDISKDSEQDAETRYASSLKHNATWLSLMCRKFGFSDERVISDKLDNFLLDNACSGKVHRNLQDFQSHFVSCLKISQQCRVPYMKSPNSTPYGNNQRNAAWSNRRGTEPTATCAQDYVASFSAFDA